MGRQGGRRWQPIPLIVWAVSIALRRGVIVANHRSSVLCLLDPKAPDAFVAGERPVCRSSTWSWVGSRRKDVGFQISASIAPTNSTGSAPCTTQVGRSGRAIWRDTRVDDNVRVGCRSSCRTSSTHSTSGSLTRSVRSRSASIVTSGRQATSLRRGRPWRAPKLAEHQRDGVFPGEYLLNLGMPVSPAQSPAGSMTPPPAQSVERAADPPPELPGR